MRPPLRPLDSKTLRTMIADARVIAIGTVTSVSLSKTVQPPRETVIIHATMKPERILKGHKAMEAIEIVESYQQFSVDNTESAPGDGGTRENSVTARTAGPTPPVGKYRNGDRILVFLQSTEGSGQYRPLGSGDHGAYLGVFQITSEGIKSDRYRFDEIVSEHASSEAGFLNFITSMIGG